MKFLKNSKIIFAIVFFLAFAILSKYEDRAVVKTIDFAATVKVQDKIDKSVHLRLAAIVDNTMEGATFFASPEFSIILIFILTILFFKKYRFFALLIPVLFLFLTFGEILGKTIVHHPSPPFAMIKHPTSIFPANYINEQFSYPSGHVARAVFIAIVSWVFFRKKWLGIGMGAYVFLVFVSRIYLGHHWLTDCIGGACLGSGLGLLTLTLKPRIIAK